MWPPAGIWGPSANLTPGPFSILFFFSNAFGWRGQDEQAEAKWVDVSIIDEGGLDEHLKWNERGSKTRKGQRKTEGLPLQAVGQCWWRALSCGPLQSAKGQAQWTAEETGHSPIPDP